MDWIYDTNSRVPLRKHEALSSKTPSSTKKNEDKNQNLPN
jgi:hypothetical protein